MRQITTCYAVDKARSLWPISASMDHTENKAVCDVLIVEKAETKKLKSALEKHGIFNKKFRIKQFDEGKFAVPIHRDEFDAHENKNQFPNDQHISSQILMPFSKAYLISLTSAQKSLTEALLDEFYSKMNKSLEDECMDDIPQSWHIYGDMLVLPRDSMQNRIWDVVGPCIWEVFCKTFNVKRVARHNVILDDQFRSSKVELLHGDNGWVRRKDNGIIYEYDITKCMFSDGNITEKIRIAKMDCANETVVDLFAGIGYYVIPFLVHANAELVYACEWNANAVEALKRNLEINGVSERCMVLEGDNRKVAPKGVADRVNLGLIPSSESSWYTACACLKPHSGGWLHVHANVNSSSLQEPSDVDSEANSCFMNLSDGDELRVCSQSSVADMKVSVDGGEDNEICARQRSKYGISSEVRDKINQKCNEDISSLCDIFDNNVERQSVIEPTKKLLHTAVNKRDNWNKWATNQALTIQGLLERIHRNNDTGTIWKCDVRHIEYVKSYAPHIDHIVVDMECRPFTVS